MRINVTSSMCIIYSVLLFQHLGKTSGHIPVSSAFGCWFCTFAKKKNYSDVGSAEQSQPIMYTSLKFDLLEFLVSQTRV